MARQILIVDHSASMRRIIAANIYANIGDGVVTQATDLPEAAEIIANQECHAMIAFWANGGPLLLDLLESQRQQTDRKTKIPMIALFLKGHEESIAEARDAGVDECILVPCSADDLSGAINRVCSPVKLRRSRRYNLPGTVAVLEQGTGRFQAEVVNFSSGGLLCELDFQSQINCGAPIMVTVNFALNGRQAMAGGLLSSFSAMNVIASNPDYSPQRIRLALSFISTPEDAAQVLTTVCAEAERQGASLEV